MGFPRAEDCGAKRPRNTARGTRLATVILRCAICPSPAVSFFAQVFVFWRHKWAVVGFLPLPPYPWQANGQALAAPFPNALRAPARQSEG